MPDNSLAPKTANQNSSNQIKDPETLKQLARIYEDIIIRDNIKEAFKFSNIIETKITQIQLADTDKELFNKYQDFAVKLKWIALPWLKNHEVVSLFKNHFIKIFEIEFFSVWEKFKKKLLTLLLLEERDELKEQIKNALLSNQEKITSQKLAQGQAPTISNWLKDYTSKLSIDPTNKAKQAEYLTSSENTKSLGEPEKNKLKTLFNIFERAKLSSSTIEGIEEPIPVFDDPNNEGEIIEGQFVKYKDKEKIIAGLKKMAKITGSGDFEEDLSPEALAKGEEPEKESEKPESAPAAKPQEERTRADNLHQLTQQIISQSNLKFPDENLNSRFQNIILSRLRNVRNFITAKEALIRSPKIGGLGIAPDQAEKIARLIETEAVKIHQSKEIMRQEKEKQPQSYLDNILQGYSLEQSLKEKSEQETRNKKQETRKEEESGREVDKVNKVNKIVNKDEGEIKSAFVPDRASSSAKPFSRQTIQPSSRQAVQPQPPAAPKPAVGPIKMQEIRPPANIKYQIPNTKQTPIIKHQISQTFQAAKPSSIKRVESISQPAARLTGEVEEIGLLKLADFRRWSTEPQESATRVKEKIELTEKESLEKKAQAIRAWQNSEINKLYLKMGQDSMLQDQTIEAVIKIRQAENKPTLTMQEFEAIADLNKELNF